jgi:hypothetical protein
MADAADTDANRTLKPKRKTRARATTAQAKQGDTKHTNTEPLFSLGHLGMSPGALTALLALSLDPNVFIKRHVTGDWSEMEAEDQEVNRRALSVRSRVFSAYTFGANKKLWVITEADRSSTMILLPGEY